MIIKVKSKAAPEVRGTISRRRWLPSLRFAVLAALLSSSHAAAFETLEPWTGPEAVSLALDDLGGTRHVLAEHRGRPVIVHFFATWCEPCRRELPGLAALASRYPPPRLSVVAISVAEPASRIRRFFQTLPVTFPVLIDRNRAAARAWTVDVLPTTILLDADLKPRLAVQGEFDWSGAEADAAVKSLMAPDSPQNQQFTAQGG